MRLAIALVAATAALSAAGAAAAGPSVQIKDAVARITVIPEDRNDVKVEMLTTNRDLPLEVRTAGSETVISGGLWHRIYNCHARGEHPGAWVRGVGGVKYEDIPQVVIHTPRSVDIEAGGSVLGTIGRSASLNLENSGCSAWTVADVSGDATLRESGAGSVNMGSAGRLEVRLSGAGNIHATQVRQDLNATISGTGAVTIDDLAGDVEAHVSGLGKIRIAHGNANAVRASISGIGSVDFGGRAEKLDASISGIGGIHVKEVTGQVTKSISGGGHVTVG